ncbi:hypothetical protein AC579_8512 [Pseudocercospora musae]|uniref:Uncharacterized protein n=1 Tax=Pseudocercospora musae TaxID=113226 RepID=A0A139IAE8_9PEZI|nr:hypothetical protein AC579_8512 [Pseudocercospora musae]
MRNVPSGNAVIVFAPGTSGVMVMQLSRATATPGLEPPQIRTSRGSEKGACWGITTAVPSNGDTGSRSRASL